VHNVRQWPNLRHLGESLGELKACGSSGFKFYMALDARLPADWVQTGDPGIQGSIYLTTSLVLSRVHRTRIRAVYSTDTSQPVYFHQLISSQSSCSWMFLRSSSHPLLRSSTYPYCI